jgi:predicted regulator of Ras-like GTPase activity (Roadblock/LC7/MglB family)
LDAESRIQLELEHLRSINGVDNSFLAQCDGYPIASAGVWLSPDEIFGISAAASAIYAVARRLHRTLKYVLVEGDQVKFLVVAFPKNDDYFLSLTTRTQANLGVILQSLQQCTPNISPLLLQAGTLPPLRSYSNGQEASILNRFKTQDKPIHSSSASIRSLSLILTEPMVVKLRALLADFTNLLDGAHPTFISLHGGYPIAPLNHMSPSTSFMSAFTFALYDTCRKVAWITKRTVINQVMVDLGSQHHFIYNTGTSIFSTTLQKGNCRLGYLRLLIPTYTARIEETLQQASHAIDQRPLKQPMNRFLNGFFSSFQTSTLSG